jgi:hypothetical protein
MSQTCPFNFNFHCCLSAKLRKESFRNCMAIFEKVLVLNRGFTFAFVNKLSYCYLDLNQRILLETDCMNFANNYHDL